MKTDAGQGEQSCCRGSMAPIRSWKRQEAHCKVSEGEVLAVTVISDFQPQNCEVTKSCCFET
jgi:hypothetical protein